MVNENGMQWVSEQVLEIAKRQKQIIWMILLRVIFMLFPPAALVVALIQVFFVYKLAQAIESKAAWLYMILLFIPLVGLITLLMLNGKATKKLKENDVRVGLMGAKEEDLERYRQYVAA